MNYTQVHRVHALVFHSHLPAITHPIVITIKSYMFMFRSNMNEWLAVFIVKWHEIFHLHQRTLCWITLIGVFIRNVICHRAFVRSNCWNNSGRLWLMWWHNNNKFITKQNSVVEQRRFHCLFSQYGRGENMLFRKSDFCFFFKYFHYSIEVAVFTY